MAFQRTDDQMRSKKKKRHSDETTSSKSDFTHGKRLRKRKKKDINCLADAIRTCVPGLIRDVTFNELEDKALENGCLTDDECGAISNIGDRKKQVRKAILIITKRSFETMANFLEALKPAYLHLFEDIWQQYEINMTKRPAHLIIQRLCPLCQLKNSVDVEKVTDDLFAGHIIDDQLYDNINSSRKKVGKQGNLWNAVLKACVRNEGVERLLESLESTDHYSHITKRLRYLFRNNRNTKQFCTCSRHSLDKRVTKFRTLSLDSATSCSPRDTSDSVSSTNSDIKSMSETDTVSSVNVIIPTIAYSNETTSVDSAQAMITESTESYDPLINYNNIVYDTICEVTPEEKSKHETYVQLEGKQGQVIGKEPIAIKRNSYELPLPDYCQQKIHVSDREQSKRRKSGKFRSVVSATLVQLRVLRQLMKKNHKTVFLESHNSHSSENICETVL